MKDKMSAKGGSAFGGKNKKEKIVLKIIVFIAFFFLSYNFSLAAVCEKNGDPCTLSTNGAAGKCNNKTGTMLCYPNAATTQSGAQSGGVVRFTNPLEFNTVEDLLTNIMSAIQKIVVVLSLVVIVIGAVMYIISAGSPETVERGKKAITMALVGLTIAIAAPSILKELAAILGWGKVPANVSAAMSLSDIAVRTLNFLLGITGVIAIIMMVVGAIMYLTSAGDEDRIDRGKKIFTYSILGVVIALSSMVIVRQIATLFATG